MGWGEKSQKEVKAVDRMDGLYFFIKGNIPVYLNYFSGKHSKPLNKHDTALYDMHNRRINHLLQTVSMEKPQEEDFNLLAP